ncbi:Zinc knuckle CX2CX4HX4C [Corchorus olitorius]|uniref:Zinc knuckle CX2CX4HX4C n=1 Tax=Corchorus olitorius TaxID=93759 RepID=A0A1R3IT52_9ROSI|nr:Zinc knuckle CX2CX4HX4C [Corchorus olitorius]
MKIEAKARTEKLNRRFRPYLTLKRRRIIMQTTTFEFKEPSFNSYHTTMTEANHLNIKFLRECSWTDNDSPTKESEEEVESNIQATHPRPTAPFRSRISHRVRISSKDVMVTREEANKCIVGFLLDMRRFSSETIQRWANQEWDPHGLPVEYQNNIVAEKLARTAGEIIKIDWVHRRPRNIRFLRVRIALDPRQPLASGCTLERDDGTVHWVDFSYEQINKLCLSCGMLGHTHPYCSNDAVEVDRMVRQRMRPITERYGHPIITDPQNNMFYNRIRAFLHRASRRTTRIAYGQPRNRQSQLPSTNIEASEFFEIGGTSGTARQNVLNQHDGDNREQTSEGGLSHEEEGAQLALVSQGNEDVQIQLQSLILREESIEGVQNTTEVVELVPEEESTQIIETTEILGQMRVQEELEVLSSDSGQHSQIIQQEDPTQHQLPLGDISQTDLSVFEYPTLEPILDPLSEFDISVTRLDLLEQRYNSGYHNLADLEDMQFALYREHGRFEQICDEMVRQSTELLEGLQNRSLNDPTIQPADNNVRWISLPDGGAVYTNARLEMGGRKDIAESSQMGSNRNKPPTLLLGSGSPVNPTSPGFICSINEEDLMSAFLRNTPSPDEGPPEADEEGKEVIKENSLEGDGICEEENQTQGTKRKREEDEQAEKDSEEGRRMRQRTQASLAHERETRLKEGSLAEGSRHAVPQQQPQEP